MTKRIIIQCRVMSNRLPGKALLTIYGLPLIIAIVKRVKGFTRDIYVCTTKNKEDNILCNILKAEKIKYSRGPEKNVLKRFIICSKDLKAEDTIIRLTADNPLPDKYFLRDMNKIWSKNNFTYLASESKKNNIPKGLSAEFFKVKYLRKAYRYAKTQKEKEHVTTYIIKNEKTNYLSKKFIKKRTKKVFGIDTLNDYFKVFKIMKGDIKNNILKKYTDFI